MVSVVERDEGSPEESEEPSSAARAQTNRPPTSDNEGEKSAKRHTRTQSSFLGQRDRSRRMVCLPAGGGRTRGAGGGWRRRGSPSRARGEGGGVSPSRGVGRRRDRGAGWTATPPPLAPPRAPGRSRRGAWRRDPEKDPRRRALPGSTLASARRAPKAAARRAGAGAGSAAARSRSAAGRSGANERAPSSDLARALVTEPARGAGRRRKAGRVGAAGRRARGGFERGTHLSACSASLALYTRSARDRPARSSGAVIGLMAGGRGRASANAARVGCGPMGARRSRPRVREPSSERP